MRAGIVVAALVIAVASTARAEDVHLKALDAAASAVQKVTAAHPSVPDSNTDDNRAALAAAAARAAAEEAIQAARDAATSAARSAVPVAAEVAKAAATTTARDVTNPSGSNDASRPSGGGTVYDHKPRAPGTWPNHHYHWPTKGPSLPTK